jgi:predicted secreted protein
MNGGDVSKLDAPMCGLNFEETAPDIHFFYLRCTVRYSTGTDVSGAARRLGRARRCPAAHREDRQAHRLTEEQIQAFTTYIKGLKAPE